MRRRVAIAAALVCGAVVAALIVRDRALAWAIVARRTAELDEKLAAARALIARDLGDDGIGVAPPIAGLPPTRPGEMGFLSIDPSPAGADDWTVAGGTFRRGPGGPRAVLHRWRVNRGALELAEGGGGWQTIATGIDAIAIDQIAPSLPDARGELYVVSVSGGGRSSAGEVLARGHHE